MLLLSDLKKDVLGFHSLELTLIELVGCELGVYGYGLFTIVEE